MNKQLKETLGWGVVLWLIGYILGIVLFAFVPSTILGWIIMPVGKCTLCLDRVGWNVTE